MTKQPTFAYHRILQAMRFFAEKLRERDEYVEWSELKGAWVVYDEDGFPVYEIDEDVWSMLDLEFPEGEDNGEA